MASKGNTFKRGSHAKQHKDSKVSNTSTVKKRSSAFKSFNNIDFSERQRKLLKILGLFLILTSFLFTVAFVSYLFTWKEDQSYIAATNGGWSTLFSTSEEIHNSETAELPVVENKLGKLGALLANQ
ncbi:DUF2975 domain-containing protein, partial [Parapusillimonas sp. SGNA-6]|nr:DUF2975 domain-containing protein [Parapusillimonas sp. SGNA-6]